MRKLWLIVSLFIGIGSANAGMFYNQEVMCCVLLIPQSSLAPIQETVVLITANCKQDVQYFFLDGKIMEVFEELKNEYYYPCEQMFYVFVYEIEGLTSYSDSPNYVYNIVSDGKNHKITGRVEIKQFSCL